jgi:hypothetical protein
MDHDIAIVLLARSMAFDLLLRQFYTVMGAIQPDPKKWIFENIETIIGSMDEVEARPRSKEEQVLWDLAQIELHQFADNVGGRFNDDGTPKMRRRPGAVAETD